MSNQVSEEHSPMLSGNIFSEMQPHRSSSLSSGKSARAVGRLSKLEQPDRFIVQSRDIVPIELGSSYKNNELTIPL